MYRSSTGPSDNLNLDQSPPTSRDDSLLYRTPKRIFGQPVETFTLQAIKNILSMFKKQGSIRKTSTLDTLMPKLIDLESKVTFKEHAVVAQLLANKQPLKRAALAEVPRVIDEGGEEFEARIVEKYLSGELLHNYREYMYTYAMSKLPGFCWCLSPSCRSGQVHTPGDKSPKMLCQKCGFATCYTHQLPWHDGKTCEQVGDLKSKDERATEQWIKSQTKACPGCGVATVKNGGCAGIFCVCGKNWDWDRVSLI
ncbi:hypothetical protein NHQ30_002450 [Ciborinia camelliae]|nr:hypothetical protein NHQ30_002450 [Ciborinia camelliae]